MIAGPTTGEIRQDISSNPHPQIETSFPGLRTGQGELKVSKNPLLNISSRDDRYIGKILSRVDMVREAAALRHSDENTTVQFLDALGSVLFEQANRIIGFIDEQIGQGSEWKNYGDDNKFYIAKKDHSFGQKRYTHYDDELNEGTLIDTDMDSGSIERITLWPKSFDHRVEFDFDSNQSLGKITKTKRNDAGTLRHLGLVGRAGASETKRKRNKAA